MIVLQVPEIDLRRCEPEPLMARVEEAYVERHGANPESRSGWYDADNWARVAQVFQRTLKGGDLLDVGPGAGQFANCAALSGQFGSVTVLDKTWHKKYLEVTDGITRVDGSIAAMDFPDNSFDVVTCLEVLEHLPPRAFDAAIDELRRVCRGQLIITVPYREAEPLPKFHLRRFDDEDLVRLFPHADFAVLRRRRTSWVLIEERPNEPSRRTAVTRPDAEWGSSRVELLEQQVAALQARKALRTVNWLGTRSRRVRRRIRKLASRP